MCWVFIAAQVFSSCSKQGLLSSCAVRASHRSGFSCCGTRALGHVGFSSCGPQALEHSLYSCDARASLLCSMWDLPESGIELVSPALAGRFSTTEPPGKCLSDFLMSEGPYSTPRVYGLHRFLNMSHREVCSLFHLRRMTITSPFSGLPLWLSW